MIYRICPGDDLNTITSVWGECDILDIIFLDMSRTENYLLEIYWVEATMITGRIFLKECLLRK